MAWVRISKLCEHIDSSPRTVRNYMAKGMPHSKLHNGTLLFNLSDVDDWFRSFSVDRDKDAAAVDEILNGIFKKPKVRPVSCDKKIMELDKSRFRKNVN